MAKDRSEALSLRLAGLRADYTFAVLDTGLIVLSYLATLSALQILGSSGSSLDPRVAVVVVLAVLLHVGLNAAYGLYGRVWRFAGVDEARRIILAGTTVAGCLTVLLMLRGLKTHPAEVVLGPAVATALIGAMRFRARLFAWQRQGSAGAEGARRVAVVGSGPSAASIIRDMRSDPGSTFLPVLVVDDDPRMRGLSIAGVQVRGSLSQLPSLLTSFAIDRILLAVPSPDPTLVTRVADIASTAGVPLRILPCLRDMVAGVPASRQIREVRIEDLLGRKEVVTDYGLVAELLGGRTVLVTGAGGSIGSEIAAQVSRFQPSALVLLDHDETLLHDAHARLSHQATEVLADVRDAQGVRAAFERFRPDLVFHAAALKHVPILESHPLEAIRTNIFGTQNVLEAAAAVGVQRVVFISTDKAVRPSSVMGATKWVAEQLVMSYAEDRPGYCCVRFGNVLGSRGSVVPTFRRQIAAGGPVTVTDPAMTRFFMSVEEAVQLVLQSAVMTKRNELFMLEMGEAVNIHRLAQRMIKLSVGPDVHIPITFTGMRPGEKLAEQLVLSGDNVELTEHASIRRVLTGRYPTVALTKQVETLRSLVTSGASTQAAATLVGLASWTDEEPGVIDLVTQRVPERGSNDRIAGSSPA